MKKGLKEFRYFTGNLRKNAKNRGETAFVTLDDPEAPIDVYIPSMYYQSRALHLNRVVVELFDVST